jgi:hypothetical protein
MRKPMDIYQEKGVLYMILSQKHTAQPSLHLKFKMNLSEELGNFNENKSSESSSSKSVNVAGAMNQSKISSIEKEIFKA